VTMSHFRLCYRDPARSWLVMLVEHAGQNEHDQGQSRASQGEIPASSLLDRDMALHIHTLS
jgi:hypothetical protein